MPIDTNDDLSVSGSFDSLPENNQNKEIQNATISVAPYVPTSQNCGVLNTVVPIRMLYEQAKSLSNVDRKVGGVDLFVMDRLQYDSLEDMCRAIAAEQVDAVALAIFNREYRNKGTIISDATGVGKGRIAASLIRYAYLNGLIPFFLTEKPNLFSDIYRDLAGIGSDDNIPLRKILDEKKKVEKKPSSREVEAKIAEDVSNGEFELEGFDAKNFYENLNEANDGFKASFKKTKEYKDAKSEYLDLYFENEEVFEDQYVKNKNYEQDIIGKKRMIPFIVNGSSAKSKIKDLKGNILYEGDTAKAKSLFQNRKFTEEDGDLILGTYSQFRAKKDTDKKAWLKWIANKCFFILDEAHNASGSSNIGEFLKEVLSRSAGVVFLSATYAKRPDNMPIYASKTSINDSNLENDTIIKAFETGGVALQEVVSSQLTKEGEVLRRERSYEGVSVRYRILDESQEDEGLNYKEQHIANSDKITDILRDIIYFQQKFVDPVISKKDEEASKSQSEVYVAKGDKEAGISNSPAFSGVFNIINQMLLAINADAVAEMAIRHLKNGRKPIIALSNTMESLLDTIEIDTENGIRKARVGDEINTDFSYVLMRRLKNALRYRVTDGDNVDVKFLDIDTDLSLEGQEFYKFIVQKIKKASTGLNFSPIDYIKHKIKSAGFTVDEVTGRGRYVEIVDSNTGIIKKRNIRGANDIFRDFNDNVTDCLLINQSGATGASAHAIPTSKVTIVRKNEQGQNIIPNSLEPRNEVKQRVMLVLQPELDINLEVQKRGRINRTGQVFPPIYEYVSSAIPAQSRLLMMLQKKLKSLDSLTTSNQKQSKSIIDIQDFLNKVGDRLVVEYLKSNPNINNLIGNPLKFEDGQPSDDTMAIPDKANKVSGRIALLDVEKQSSFYETMSMMYLAEIKALDAKGENDLEVERLDFRATTLLKKLILAPVIQGSKNYFSKGVYLEKIEVNNLRKPYKKDEIVKMIERTLSFTGDDGITISIDKSQYSSDLIKESNAFWDFKKETEIEGYVRRYEKKKESIVEKFKSKKFENEQDRKGAIEIALSELEESMKEDIRNEEEIIQRNRRRAESIFSSFVVGDVYAIPTKTYNVDSSYNYAIFIGFEIERKAKNPFAPSNIKVQFALDNGVRFLSIPTSKPEVEEILSASRTQLSYIEKQRIFDGWDEHIKNNSYDRINRYVLTGNLLRAFAMGSVSESYANGRLIEYTLMPKEGSDIIPVKKGYLLPQEFDGTKVSNEISVPIHYLIKYYEQNPNSYKTFMPKPYIEIEKTYSGLMFTLSGNREEYKEYLEDEKLISLLRNNQLRKARGRNDGFVDSSNYEAFFNHLWEKYALYVSISQDVLAAMGYSFEMDDEDDYDEIIDPLNVINKDFEDEEKRIAEEEERRKEDEERMLIEQEAEMERLRIVERKNAIHKKLDELIAELI